MIPFILHLYYKKGIEILKKKLLNQSLFGLSTKKSLADAINKAFGDEDRGPAGVTLMEAADLVPSVGEGEGVDGVHIVVPSEAVQLITRVFYEIMELEVQHFTLYFFNHVGNGIPPVGGLVILAARYYHNISNKTRYQNYVINIEH